MQELIGRIREKAQKEANELIRRAKRVAERDIAKAKQKVEEWLKAERAALIKERIALIARKRARFAKEIRDEETAFFSNIWADICSDFWQGLRSLIEENRQAYVEALSQICAQKVKEYPESQWRLRVNPADMEELQARLGRESEHIIFEADETLTGGIVVESRLTGIAYDYSMRALFEYFEEELKRAVLIKGYSLQ